MLVYQIYHTLDSRAKAIAFSHLDMRPWKTLFSFLGFYKEAGGHAECVLLEESGRMFFRYTTEKDVLILVSKERNVLCRGEWLDLLCWKKSDEDRSYWSFAKYMGFAKPIGRNIYMIPA